MFSVHVMSPHNEWGHAHAVVEGGSIEDALGLLGQHEALQQAL